MSLYLRLAETVVATEDGKGESAYVKSPCTNAKETVDNDGEFFDATDLLL
jgi:hypothetical protein